MTSDWPTAKLGEVCEKIGSGATPRGGADVYVQQGVRLIRSQNVHDLRFEFRGLAYINKAQADRLRGVAVRPGDVLVNITGDSVARVCMAPSDGAPARVNQHVAIVRSDGVRLLPEFAAYWLVSPQTKAHLLRLASAGATRRALTKLMLEMLEVPLPDPEVQRHIGSVLRTLDRKIESNDRTRRTVQDAVATLFGETIRAGPVDATSVGDLIERGVLVIGDGLRAKNSELGPDGLPFARAGNLHDGFDFTRADRLPESRALTVRSKCSAPGDVVFTSKGTVGRFALVDEQTERFVYSPQLCFWRSLDYERLPPAVLFSWMQSSEARRQMDALKGQTDMADYVSLRDQRSMVISLPRQKTLSQLAQTLEPLTMLAGRLRSESRALRQLRDTLLPRLMSGEMQVPEASGYPEAFDALAEVPA